MLEDVKRIVEKKVSAYEELIRKDQEEGKALTKQGHEAELRGFLEGVTRTVLWTMGADAESEIRDFIFDLGW